jgi:hypothetical protein
MFSVLHLDPLHPARRTTQHTVIVFYRNLMLLPPAPRCLASQQRIAIKIVKSAPCVISAFPKFYK